MLILATDTTTETASVALLNNTDVLIEIFINLSVNHSTVLLPAIETALSITGVNIRDIDYFACTVGPGSFTGIRIGASTVKGFALATDKPVIGVSTLEALAMNLSGGPVLVCPMLDARKGQVYAALYRTNDDGIQEILKKQCVTDVNHFLPDIDRETIFIGEGAVKYKESIKKSLPGLSFFATTSQQYVKASSVGFLAVEKINSGAFLDLASFDLEYLRQSEAESMFPYRGK